MTIGIVSATYIAAAVLATVFGPGVGSWLVFLLMVAGGAVLGPYVAARVRITKIPQMVAALH
jgi:NAD(P) transhydrogenase subunit beta